METSPELYALLVLNGYGQIKDGEVVEMTEEWVAEAAERCAEVAERFVQELARNWNGYFPRHGFTEPDYGKLVFRLESAIRTEFLKHCKLGKSGAALREGGR